MDFVSDDVQEQTRQVCGRMHKDLFDIWVCSMFESLTFNNNFLSFPLQHLIKLPEIPKGCW